MQWRKWRNWRKIASLWRFELDAKSGPLEAGDFGEKSPEGWRYPECGKIFKLVAKSGPFKVDN